MKKITGLFISIFFAGISFSQDMKSFRLYKPEENAEQGIADALKQAKAENKNVFVQIGGNWCIWCARFNDITTNDKSID